MNAIPRIAIAAALLAALSACGNKGPLVQAPPPTPAADEALTPDPAVEADPAAEAVSTEEAAPVVAPEPDPDVPVEEDEPLPAEGDGTP